MRCGENLFKFYLLKNTIMTKWNDVYSRSTLNDSGTSPRPGTAASPDIIPYGLSPIDNPGDFFVVKNWDKDLGKTLDARIMNYIYFRASNLAGKEQTGKLYLYYSQASLLLYPNLWEKNVLKTQDGKDHYEFKVSKDGKLVSGMDDKQGTFVWKPEMITNDHYCLVGRIVTPDHPNDIPKVGDIDDFSVFIATNLNYAWRNVTVIDRNSPDWSQTVDYAQGDLAGAIKFILKCTNLPIGSEVMFSCHTTGPKPLIAIEKTKITSSESQLCGVECNVPAGFKGDITYSYWSNGIKPAKGFKIDLEAVYIPNEASRLHVLGLCKPMSEFGLNEELMDGIGPKVGVKVGSHSIQSD